MTKTSLILTYFQKSALLTTENPSYCKTLTSLFTWLTKNDAVDRDTTTQLLFPCYHVLKHDNMDSHTARLVAKEEIIVSGIEEIAYILKNHTSLALRVALADGRKAKRGQTIGEISGNTSDILVYERTIVNILQRMSGIASQTHHFIKITKDTYSSDRSYLCPQVAATRKTPWMSLDKKAVAVGGGLTHRIDLSNGLLIKDNHLEAIKAKYHLKSISSAIQKALEVSLASDSGLPAEACELDSGNQHIKMYQIEVKTEEEARIALTTYLPADATRQALQAGNLRFDRPELTVEGQPTTHTYLALLFDNFTPNELRQTIQHLDKEFDLSKIILEGSGGINEKNIVDFAKTGVDILSLGSLTHSARAANISLEF